MKTAIRILLAALFVSTAAYAQVGTPVYPTVDPGATFLTRAHLSTYVEVEVQAKKKGEDIGNEIFVWRTSGNMIATEVSTPTIAPTTGMAIDDINTVELYRQLALASVNEAIARGYVPVGVAQTVTVWFESRVERTGTGLATRFAACPSYDAASLTFSVTWNNGSPVVTQIASPVVPAPCGTSGGIN